MIKCEVCGIEAEPTQQLGFYSVKDENGRNKAWYCYIHYPATETIDPEVQEIVDIVQGIK